MPSVYQAAAGALVIAAGLAALLASPSSASETGVIARINGEGGSVTVLDPAQGTHTGDLHEGDKTYRILEQDPNRAPAYPALNDRHRPIEQIRHHLCLPTHGARCLVFQGYNVPTGCPAGCPSDRLEVVLSHGNDEGAMRFDDWRFLRFWLNVHPDSTIGDERAVISQTWQLSSGAQGDRPALGPAFAIKLKRNADPTKIDIHFTYRDDVSEANEAKTFYKETIEKGTWFSYHVKMKPRHDEWSGGRGVILIWRDKGLSDPLIDSEALNYNPNDDPTNESKHKFFWGYPPEDVNPDNVGLTDTFDIRVGLYRPAPMEMLTFWMDSIKLTDNLSDLYGS